jgi:hypothetical protein
MGDVNTMEILEMGLLEKLSKIIHNTRNLIQKEVCKK